MFKIKFNRLQLITHIGSLIPFFVLIYDGFTGGLTVNPIQEITQRTGRLAFIWLILSLACTPLNIVFGFKPANRIRRPLGLYAAFYAGLHFLTFSILDYGLNLSLIFQTIREKPYIIVGSIALIILIVLTITSTQAWMKRLGKKWQLIHSFIYLAGALVLLHSIWAVKADVRLPVFLGVILAILLFTRIKPIRNWFVRHRPGWIKPVNEFVSQKVSLRKMEK